MINNQQSFPDPLAEFLAQLLSDAAPEVPAEHFVCRWAVGQGICGATVSKDREVATAHLRTQHGMSGNERESAECLWNDCQVAPMQRRSLIRHVLAVHLRILQWTCPVCAGTFTRKDTIHRCNGGTH